MDDVPSIMLVHAIAAALALVLGPIQFLNRKGSGGHRFMGYLLVILLIVTSVSSFWITEINDGGFSPIHALSVITLLSLARALWAARHHDMHAHKRAMIWTYVGLVSAFAFTLLPGRLTHEILFLN